MLPVVPLTENDMPILRSPSSWPGGSSAMIRHWMSTSWGRRSPNTSRMLFGRLYWNTERPSGSQRQELCVVIFQSKEEVIAAGYLPCGICKPYEIVVTADCFPSLWYPYDSNYAWSRRCKDDDDIYALHTESYGKRSEKPAWFSRVKMGRWKTWNIGVILAFIDNTAK